MTRLEQRCDDLQHSLDDLRSSSPVTAPFKSAVTCRYRLRKRRSVGNEVEDEDDDDEEEEDYDEIESNSGPRSLGYVEGLREEELFRRTRRRGNRFNFLVPPNSWELRKRTVRTRANASRHAVGFLPIKIINGAELWSG